VQHDYTHTSHVDEQRQGSVIVQQPRRGQQEQQHTAQAGEAADLSSQERVGTVTTEIAHVVRPDVRLIPTALYRQVGRSGVGLEAQHRRPQGNL
jgi:hypothetical protein